MFPFVVVCSCLSTFVYSYVVEPLDTVQRTQPSGLSPHKVHLESADTLERQSVSSGLTVNSSTVDAVSPSNRGPLRPWFPEAEAGLYTTVKCFYKFNHSPEFIQRDQSIDSLVGFARAIACATELNPVRYNNYGCYCGWGGSGTPVDPIDKCCQIHDNCYGKCEKDGCWPKLSPYSMTCFHGNHTPVCENGSNTPCNACCCSCDVAAAICFRDNDSHYQRGKAMCK